MNTSRQGGFTLIELITCMVIMGILAAFVGPRLIDNRAVVARGFIDELASSLRYAQRIAIASNCNVQVQINAGGYSGWQRSAFATCNTAGAWNQAVLRNDGGSLAAAPPTGVAVNSNVTLVFQFDGAVAGGTTNIDVGGRIINVDGATGRVRVQ